MGAIKVKHFVLLSFILKTKPKAIFEIGTFNGETAEFLAKNSLAQVYTLDDKRFPFENKRKPKRVFQLRGDSMDFDFSPYYGFMDIVFVDGAHDYEHVMSDSKNALKMVRRGGIVVWHDYNPKQGKQEGVIKALNELSPEGMKYIKGAEIVYYEQTQK